MSDTVQINQPGETIKVYGIHAFKVLDEPLGDQAEEVAWVRLSSFGWTPCQDIDAAGLVAGFLEMWVEADERTREDLPPGFGILANRSGEIVGVVHEAGTLLKVSVERLHQVDVPGGNQAARMSVFSLAQDEASCASGVATPCDADYWAMGRVPQ